MHGPGGHHRTKPVVGAFAAYGDSAEDGDDAAD